MLRPQQGGNATNRSEAIVRKKMIKVPMPPSRRAKQFVPFDALRGLKEAIAAKEKKPSPRKELSDYMKGQLNHTLSSLRKGHQITVVYYSVMEQEYIQVTGTVVKVDTYWKLLQINKLDIDFSDILEIVPIERTEHGMKKRPT